MSNQTPHAAHRRTLPPHHPYQIALPTHMIQSYQ